MWAEKQLSYEGDLGYDDGMSKHGVGGLWWVIGWLVILGVGFVVGFWSRGSSAEQVVSSGELQRGYALFYHLMSEEAQVDDLLIIKSPAEPLPELVKGIAATAAAVVEEMDKWKAADPTLDFKDTGLPKLEVDTRESISTMRTEQLLFHGGQYFERVLAETQASATNYAWHLAKSLASNDPDPNRAKAFEKWRDEWEKLAEAMGEVLAFSPADSVPEEEGGHAARRAFSTGTASSGAAG